MVYGLHALSLVIGAFGAASIIGSFLLGWPSIIAVIINYVKRAQVRGTFLESHFRWQIRTFWYALLWVVVAALISLPLLAVLIGFLTWPVMMFALGVWAIYRVARGWLGLAGQTQGLSKALVHRLGLEVEAGVLAVQVVSGGPAEAAGLKPGDLILTIDGREAASVDAIHKILARDMIGRNVALKALRDGAIIELSLAVQQRPRG